MADSWENLANKPAPKKLSAGAASWSPNVGAAAFVPSWLPAPAAAAPPLPPATAAPAPAPPAPAPAPAPVPAAPAAAAPAPLPVATAGPPAEEEDGEKCPVCQRPVDNHTMEELDVCISQEPEGEGEGDGEAAAPAEAEGKAEPTPEPAAAPEELVDSDPRPHVNIVFIGHVDAGKSTISGNILYLTGQVEQRTIEKFEREAKDRNRDSWFLAFIMDTNEEERAKGKTVEVGRAHFDTDAKRYTILDAPGHKNYVPNMISGAAQADVGVLVISARRGEFEAGFDRQGQTREHALLAKTLGVQKLVVVVNKMDEPTVKWSKARFTECVKKLRPFLRGCGFAVKKDVVFVPISGLTGQNLLEPVSPEICKWCQPSRSLIQTLDDLQISGRDPALPLRMPVLDRYTERGTAVMGKVECGSIRVGDTVMVMPGAHKARVDEVSINSVSVTGANPGENVVLKLRVNEAHVQKGFVLCSMAQPVTEVVEFTAQMAVLDLLDHRPLLTAGYGCVLHVHTAIEECTVKALLSIMEKPRGATKARERANPQFVKSGAAVKVVLSVPRGVCVEAFKTTKSLGRFTLRDEGRTIAIGKILSIVSK